MSKVLTSEEIQSRSVARNLGGIRGWHFGNKYVTFGSNESDGTVYVYDMGKFENPNEAMFLMVRTPFNAIKPTSVYYEEQYQLLIVGYENNLIIIFDKSGNKKATLRGHHSPVTQLQVLKTNQDNNDWNDKSTIRTKGSFLLISGSIDELKKNDVDPVIWQIEKSDHNETIYTKKITKLDNCHQMGITKILISNIYVTSLNKEIPVIISSSLDGTVVIYSVENFTNNFQVDKLTFKSLQKFNCEGGISDFVIEQGDFTKTDLLDDILLITTYSGNVYLYNLSDNFTNKLTLTKVHNSCESCLMDGERMLFYTGGGTDSLLKGWNAIDGKLLFEIDIGFITCLSQSPYKIVCGTQEGKIAVYDKIEGNLLADLDQKHSASVSHIEFMGNQIVLSGSEDGTVKFHILK
ncbi:hypothetical protein ABK040_008185 [Willaertia magna]